MRPSVWSLGQEDPLEKGMATHSMFLPGKPDEQQRLEGYSPWVYKRVRLDLQLDNKNSWNVKLTDSNPVILDESLHLGTSIYQLGNLWDPSSSIILQLPYIIHSVRTYETHTLYTGIFFSDSNKNIYGQELLPGFRISMKKSYKYIITKIEFYIQ